MDCFIKTNYTCNTELPVQHRKHAELEDVMIKDTSIPFLSNHMMLTRPWEPRSSFIPKSMKVFAAKEFPFFDSISGGTSKQHNVDILFFCAAGESSTYRRQNCSVAVEIKSSVENLYCDQKIPGYFNRTDYLYLAVPDGMIALALMKANAWKHVGVVSIDTGLIYKPALRQQPPFEEGKELVERLFIEKPYVEFQVKINPKTVQLCTLPGLERVDWRNGLPAFKSY